jgi:hypothetical protein
MSSSTPNTAKLDRILADAKRDKEMGYRDKALKMYPHVCGRCTREFAGKRLSELTVHHRDHNHDCCACTATTTNTRATPTSNILPTPPCSHQRAPRSRTTPSPPWPT